MNSHIPEWDAFDDDLMHEDFAPYLDEIIPGEKEADAIRPEIALPKPHSMDQYCSHARQLSTRRAQTTVFIGYSILPHNPQGVCH